MLNFEEISGELWQLARAGERSRVHQKGRQDFRVAVLAGVHVEEKIGERALQPCSPALVDRKSRPGDFRGESEVENPYVFTDFPMRFRYEIEFRRRSPAADFLIVCNEVADGDARMRYVRNCKQECTLFRVKL